MIDYGHSCMLVFAQSTWKESFRVKFLQDISKSFISNMEIDNLDVWNEINRSPLFNPKNPEPHNKLCVVCHGLYKIFEEKKGSSDGFILFSHNILGWKGMEKFLLFVLGQVNVKKIYYLELDQDSYTEGTTKKIKEILENINHLKIKRTDFFKLFENEQVNFNTLYEVGKY